MELRLRAINVGSSHQVRESHEVAEPVDDGARDEMSSPHEEKGRVDAEDGGVSELTKDFNWTAGSRIFGQIFIQMGDSYHKNDRIYFGPPKVFRECCKILLHL